MNAPMTSTPGKSCASMRVAVTKCAPVVSNVIEEEDESGLLTRPAAAGRERLYMAGSASSRTSPTADIGRPNSRVQSQLPGATLYSHCRPKPDLSQRRLREDPPVDESFIPREPKLCQFRPSRNQSNMH